MKKGLFCFSVFLSLGFLSAQSDRPAKEVQKAKAAELNLGKKLYAKYSCNSCHGDNGVLQGDLRQAYKKYNDEQLKDYIKSPYRYKNLKMPVYETVILETDYQALLAYIKHLGTESDKK